MRELVQLRQHRDALAQAGVEVVVATTGGRESARKGAEKYRVAFPLGLDDGTLMDRLGLRHRKGGEFGEDVFYATQLLVDAEGRVRWKYLSDRVTDRATPETILAAARAAAGQRSAST